MNASHGGSEPTPITPLVPAEQEWAGLETTPAAPGSRPAQRILQLVPPLPIQLSPQPPCAPAAEAGPVEAFTPPHAEPALAAANRLLEQELAEAREEVEALQELLEELPSIFERKFQQRLGRVLEERRRLEADNRTLWSRLRALAPAAEADVHLQRPHGLLPPGVRGAAIRLGLQDPTPTQASAPEACCDS